jgi:hypothetical protein
MGGCALDSSGSGLGTSEHGNSTIKGAEFLVYLNSCWLLKEESAPWSYEDCTSPEFESIKNTLLLHV